MRCKAGILALAGALAAIAAVPPASAGRSHENRSAPRVRGFSPAAIHAGDEFLVDAEFGSGREPRVRLGGRRLSPDSVRVERGVRADGTRRIWARVPKRFPAGRHEVRVETRAGFAAAAKPIDVASCNEPPIEPVGCDDMPDEGYAIVIEGPRGYRKVLSSPDAPGVSEEFGRTLVRLVGPAGDLGDRFTLDLPLQPVEIVTGDLADTGQSFYDFGRTVNYRKDPNGSVRIAEASDTHVGVCIDVELTGMVYGDGPPTFENVRATGHIAIPRQLPPPADCGVPPAAGVSISVTGAGGFTAGIAQPESIEPYELDDLWYADVTSASGAESFQVAFSRSPATWHVGVVGTVEITLFVSPLTDPYRSYHLSGPSGVRVVAETPTSVTICLDTPLDIDPGTPLLLPTEVRVTGFMVVTR